MSVRDDPIIKFLSLGVHVIVILLVICAIIALVSMKIDLAIYGFVVAAILLLLITWLNEID